MKYPGLPPAGSGPTRSAWALAGTDLRRAERVAGSPVDPVARVQLAEIRRRRFRVQDALAGLREGGGGAPLPQLVLAEALVWWTIGDARRALPIFRGVRETAEEDGDADLRLGALIGVARCERVMLRGENHPGLDAARAAADVQDVHLLADLDRERAGWALLRGDHAEATRLAERAADVHRGVGDRYLLGLAEVLIARARNAVGDDEGAVRQVLRVRDEAAAAGSFDLEQVCVVFAGQFLQRGAAPDTKRWRDAKDLVSRGLDAATDPFTRAELLLPMAHLHMQALEFDAAEAELAEYQRLYSIIGGNQLSVANLLKAQGRLELARAGDNPLRAAARTPATIRAVSVARKTLRRAAEAYEAAGLDGGMRTVAGHLAALDVLALGGRPGWSAGGSRLDTALQRLLDGAARQQAGDWPAAMAAYAESESTAAACGATVIAVQAASGRAEAAFAAEDDAAMLHAVRSMLGHAESIRAAVAIGPPRGNVAAVVRSEYERMAVLAARADDAALVLEIVERLRTELLAGLLRTGTQALPDDLRSLLTQIEETNTALVSATAGVRSRFTTPTVGAIAHLPAVELAERLRELHARLGRRTNSLFAAAYGAVPVAWDDILGIGSDVLALLPVLDGDTPRILAVWRSTEGAGAVTLSDLDPGLVVLRDVLGRPGAAGIVARCNLTSSDLDAVRRLLPPPFIEALRRGRRPTKLTVVPSGWLWAVPFAGVPLDEDGSVLLIDVADIALTPSLRFAVERGTRRSDAPAAPGPAVVWTAPDAGIEASEIAALAAHGAGLIELADADAVRDMLVDGGRRFRTAVVAAHGNREPGLAQGVLDRGRVVLRAADYLDGAKVPPPLLSLAACHSGYPDGDDPHEPFGLAIAARTSGVDQVLSSTFELDSRPGPATDCLADLYTALSHTNDMPAALAAAQRACRSMWREQADPLYRWAVLAVVGYHDDGRWRT